MYVLVSGGAGLLSGMIALLMLGDVTPDHRRFILYFFTGTYTSLGLLNGLQAIGFFSFLSRRIISFFRRR
jgi:hypothetical protein